MKLSRYDRPRRTTKMIFTSRDGDVVVSLLKMGPLRHDQIQPLHFTQGGASRCQRRLTLLYRNRFIDKLPDRAPNEPDVYFISRTCTKGIRHLEGVFGPEEVARRLRNPGKVAHALAVNECRIALTLGIREAGYELLEWWDEIDLAWMSAKEGMVPDGYFRVQRDTSDGPKTAAFFLEVERTARSAQAMEHRFTRYRDFYRSGSYEAWSGSKALRVLMVLATNESQRPTRRLSAATSRAEAVGGTFFRFTTMDDLREAGALRTLFGPIWLSPGSAKKVALFER